MSDSIASNKERCQGAGIWILSLIDGSQFPICWTNDWTPLIGWSKNGEWIYFVYISDRKIYRINIDSRNIETVTTLPSEPAFEIVMMPEGNGFVYSTGDCLRDIWMVENFDPDIK